MLVIHVSSTDRPRCTIISVADHGKLVRLSHIPGRRAVG